MIDAISLILGLVAGAIFSWMLAKVLNRNNSLAVQRASEQELAVLNERLKAKDQNLDDISKALLDQKAREQDLLSSNLELEKELAQLKQKLVTEEERGSLLSDLSNRFSDAFKALSHDALKSNNQSFLELANATLQRFQESAKGDLDKKGAAIDELVKPLKESLLKVDTKLEELERLRQGSHASITEQLKLLSETNLLLRDQTSNLVSALRKPAVRGRWGEIQLKRVVEMANMLPYCDFVEQESVSIEGGGRYRPDMIVKLPGKRNIVIDSKVPLEAYLEAIQSKDELQKQSFLKDHARQIKTQINNLAMKSYWQQFERSPEFVVLFLPGEIFFSTALEYEPALVEYAAERNIILATPMTLIALLRTVAYGWRENEVTENAAIVSKLGKELYERIGTAVGHLGDLRKGIEKTVESYNKTVNSLESRVLVSVRKFKELGVASADTIPELEVVEDTVKQIVVNGEPS